MKVTSKLETAENCETFLKIYINELLHIFVKVYSIEGLRSYIHDDGYFKIDLVLSDMNILILSYKKREHWELILKEIEKYL